jgi:DNA polymerase III subunit epsilon
VSGWHFGMMLSVDTETTGVDVEADRVVTACAAYVDGSGKSAPRVRNWLAWPGIDIPDGVAKIHGVTTEEARANGLPAVQVIGEVAEAIIEAAVSGIPVIAYNAVYDLTLLDRETRRYGLDPLGPALDLAGALIVDPWLLDKGLDRYRKGSRTLGAVAAHYGVKAEGAHSADGDALAAARVAWKIANDHASVTGKSTAELLAYQAKVYAEHTAWQRSKGRADALDGWPWRPLAEAAVSS